MLNERQKRFCEEYVIDLNATKAAERAGYAKKTSYSMGHELLKKPEIQAFVGDLRKKQQERCEVTADRIVNELARVAFANTTDFVSIQDIEVKKGRKKVTMRVPVFELTEDIPEDKRAAIAEISASDSGGTRIKTHDKVKALELLGKHLGVFEKDNNQKKQVFKVTLKKSNV